MIPRASRRARGCLLHPQEASGPPFLSRTPLDVPSELMTLMSSTRASPDECQVLTSERHDQDPTMPQLPPHMLTSPDVPLPSKGTDHHEPSSVSLPISTTRTQISSTEQELCPQQHLQEPRLLTQNSLAIWVPAWLPQGTRRSPPIGVDSGIGATAKEMGLVGGGPAVAGAGERKSAQLAQGGKMGFRLQRWASPGGFAAEE
ncbi:hypothetical protein P7K49_001970 [Saguinus oedipus]|uniref:Uncharacterized protein n=1 Tax=Saguinus oedipus TaxID=9490 RepID=A0ABQ9WFZ4_SAGOE|nr:hypothetical protein P7K49_001970 [Saguinus oedipus]